VRIIPSIDLAAGRSRIVHWPGVAAGIGAPSDRPEVIAERFVALGARSIHLVDFDGAQLGRPVNLEAVGRDNIRLAFAAGATRVLLAMGVADDHATLRACVDVAGDWLAVGLDPRPERFAEYPWKRPDRPSLDDVTSELVGLGVRRFVLSHGGGAPDPAFVERVVRDLDVEVLVAGGITDLAGIRRLRDAGVAGIILGEVLLSGRIDFPAAMEAAA